MKMLALLTPKVDCDRTAFAPLLVPEELVLWAPYWAGTLREWYFQPDPMTITFIYEAADPAAVERELDTLPMVKASLLDRQIIVLGPWVPLEAIFDKTLMAAN
jgi:hypothetical protein